MHNWCLDLHSGQAKAPDEGCAPSFPVRVDGGRVWLSPSRPRRRNKTMVAEVLAQPLEGGCRVVATTTLAISSTLPSGTRRWPRSLPLGRG